MKGFKGVDVRGQARQSFSRVGDPRFQQRVQQITEGLFDGSPGGLGGISRDGPPFLPGQTATEGQEIIQPEVMVGMFMADEDGIQSVYGPVSQLPAYVRPAIQEQGFPA